MQAHLLACSPHLAVPAAAQELHSADVQHVEPEGEEGGDAPAEEGAAGGGGGGGGQAEAHDDAMLDQVEADALHGEHIEVAVGEGFGVVEEEEVEQDAGLVDVVHEGAALHVAVHEEEGGGGVEEEGMVDGVQDEA